jgi:hypothetical protein
MAEKLNIHVTVQNNQTVSQFLLHENGQVIFHNDASANLKVEFNDPNALCKGGTAMASIDVDPGKKENLNVCNGTTMMSVKYTATVEPALPEDPILIIERKPINIFESSFLIAAGGLLLGLIVGYLIAHRLMSRNRPAA